MVEVKLNGWEEGIGFLMKFYVKIRYKWKSISLFIYYIYIYV